MLSGINIILPIAGAFCSFTGVSILFGFLLAAKAILFSLPITIGLPSFFGMASWACAQNKSNQPAVHYLINALIPAVCMAVFILNPTSRAAWPYALYWLIPIITACLSNSNPMLLTLQSTFVMHSVGSIMWLFLIPMTSAQWLALIPVVAIERLSMVVLTTAIYWGITTGAKYISIQRLKKSIIK
jgi:hypothetical protein